MAANQRNELFAEPQFAVDADGNICHFWREPERSDGQVTQRTFPRAFKQGINADDESAT
jgi:hypothetical protein